SPYENVTDREFPPLLVLGSLNDTRVNFTEPTKRVARIRERTPHTKVILKTEMGTGHGGPSSRYNSCRHEPFVNASVLVPVGLAQPRRWTTRTAAGRLMTSSFERTRRPSAPRR